MERKRAWVTAATIGVTFIATALSVMANTGLLHVGRPEHQLGRLTPADLAPAASAISSPVSSTSSAPRVVVKYEDVYVTAVGEPVTAATVPVVDDVPTTAATTPTTTRATRRKKRTTATATTTVSRNGASDDNDNKIPDGDEDDD